MKYSDESVFLGRGWGFPPMFSLSKGVEMIEYEEDIEQSLYILLSTLPGERIMTPTFGCDLHVLLFSPMDGLARQEAIHNIETAILFFEPRIQLNDVRIVEVHDSPNVLHIHLSYQIHAINTRNNIVYPFYFQEGTNVIEM